MKAIFSILSIMILSSTALAEFGTCYFTVPDNIQPEPWGNIRAVILDDAYLVNTVNGTRMYDGIFMEQDITTKVVTVINSNGGTVLGCWDSASSPFHSIPYRQADYLGLMPSAWNEQTQQFEQPATVYDTHCFSGIGCNRVMPY